MDGAVQADIPEQIGAIAQILPRRERERLRLQRLNERRKEWAHYNPSATALEKQRAYADWLLERSDPVWEDEDRDDSMSAFLKQRTKQREAARLRQLYERNKALQHDERLAAAALRQEQKERRALERERKEELAREQREQKRKQREELQEERERMRTEKATRKRGRPIQPNSLKLARDAKQVERAALKQVERAIANYALCYSMKRSDVTIEMVQASKKGIEGWLGVLPRS